MNTALGTLSAFLKSEKASAIGIALIVILVGTGSYAMGKSSQGGKSCIEITSPQIVQTGETSVKSVITPSVLPASQTASVSTIPSNPSAKNNTSSVSSNDALIVASNRGTKYYYTWCSGAKQLKEENKIYFKTEADAEARGLELAKNCN